jgi:hypothetical protein
VLHFSAIVSVLAEMEAMHVQHAVQTLQPMLVCCI